MSTIFICEQLKHLVYEINIDIFEPLTQSNPYLPNFPLKFSTRPGERKTSNVLQTVYKSLWNRSASPSDPLHDEQWRCKPSPTSKHCSATQAV